jgi:hypothetical protein
MVAGTIALDGDNLKPRTDQRKGGNGFGINEENVGYTLTVPDRHGVAYGIGNGQVGGACASMNAKEVAPTIDCMHDVQSVMQVNSIVKCYENHPNDSRITESGDCVQTLTQRIGTRNVFDKGESRTQEAVVYRIDPLASNSMKSANPHSGIHEVAVAQTLDTTTPTPIKNQGGDVIVEGKTFRAGSYGTYVEEGASGTLDCGHMAGIGNGTPCLVVEGVDGYNKTTTGDVAPTISGAASDIHHTHGVIVHNSNGGDVMPTINANESKLGGDNQHVNGGGVRYP